MLIFGCLSYIEFNWVDIKWSHFTEFLDFFGENIPEKLSLLIFVQLINVFHKHFLCGNVRYQR